MPFPYRLLLLMGACPAAEPPATVCENPTCPSGRYLIAHFGDPLTWTCCYWLSNN